MTNTTDSQSSSQHGSRSGAWVGAVILIGIGLIFLVRNITGYELHNWWALFLLIPTVANWGQAWDRYQHNGRRFTRSVSGPLFGGLITAVIAAVFLIDLNLNWDFVWPIVLIIIGLGMLLTRTIPE